MAALAAPTVFENPETYRLLDFTDRRLTFGIRHDSATGDATTSRCGTA